MRNPKEKTKTKRHLALIIAIATSISWLCHSQELQTNAVIDIPEVFTIPMNDLGRAVKGCNQLELTAEAGFKPGAFASKIGNNLIDVEFMKPTKAKFNMKGTYTSQIVAGELEVSPVPTTCDISFEPEIKVGMKGFHIKVKTVSAAEVGKLTANVGVPFAEILKLKMGLLLGSAEAKLEGKKVKYPVPDTLKITRARITSNRGANFDFSKLKLSTTAPSYLELTNANWNEASQSITGNIKAAFTGRAKEATLKTFKANGNITATVQGRLSATKGKPFTLTATGPALDVKITGLKSDVFKIPNAPTISLNSIWLKSGGKITADIAKPSYASTFNGGAGLEIAARPVSISIANNGLRLTNSSAVVNGKISLNLTNILQPLDRMMTAKGDLKGGCDRLYWHGASFIRSARGNKIQLSSNARYEEWVCDNFLGDHRICRHTDFVEYEATVFQDAAGLQAGVRVTNFKGIPNEVEQWVKRIFGAQFGAREKLIPNADLKKYNASFSDINFAKGTNNKSLKASATIKATIPISRR